MPSSYLKHHQDISRKTRRGGSGRNDQRSRRSCPTLSKDWRDNNASRIAVECKEFAKETSENLQTQDTYPQHKSKATYIDERKQSTLKACVICFDSKPVIPLMKNCNHGMACYSCLRESFVVQAQQDVTNYPLRCFYPFCERIVTTDILLRHGILKTEDAIQKHYRLCVLAKALRGTQSVVHCPRCDHPKHFTSSGSEIQCRLCREKFQAIDPASFKTTTEVSTIWAVSHFDADDKGINDGWARCPSCQMIISKGDGCDHVACPCGQHFYFSEWKQIPIPEVQVKSLRSNH